MRPLPTARQWWRSNLLGSVDHPLTLLQRRGTMRPSGLCCQIWLSQQADSTCVSCISISFSASSSATYATSDSFSFSRRCCSHDQAPVAVQQQAARRLFDRPDAPRRWLVTEPHLATHATRGDVLPLSAQEEILERFDIHSKTLFEYAPHERLGDQWETVPPRLLGLGHEGSPEAHQVVREPLVRQGFRRRAPFPLSARASPWG